MKSRRNHFSRGGQLVAVALSVILIAPVWGAPADVLMSPAALPGDPAPKTREISATDATVSTQTGALTYGYPIVVPPGRGGMQPSLVLSYSSQAPIYGGIAQGWSLNIPEIRVDQAAGLAPLGPNGQRLERFTSTMAGNKPLVEICANAQGVCAESVTSDVARVYRAQHDSSYARYHKLADAEDAAWRVMTTDGITHYFGESSAFSSDGPDPLVVPSHVFPLTRSVDPFGNTVRYLWKVKLYRDGTSEDLRSYRLSSIEYTTNPRAGLSEAFAKVVFDSYAGGDFGDNEGFPVGASLVVHDPKFGEEFDTGVWFEGAEPLLSIQTWVRDVPGASFRQVRRYDLSYAFLGGGTPAYGKNRSLNSITQIGDPDGDAVSLPPTRFSYGPGTNGRDARHPVVPKTVTWPPVTGTGTTPFLAAGTRPQLSQFGGVDYMLMDLDGDSRLDYVSAKRVGDECQAQWWRNNSGATNTTTDISFETTARTFTLPTIPWSGAGFEGCSLTGQKVNTVTNTDPPQQCSKMGSYLIYRFMDLNADGLPELVTAMHEDAAFYEHTGDLASIYGAGNIPTCEVEEPHCNTVDPACLDAATVCRYSQQEETEYCEFDQGQLDDCVASAPTKSCSDLALGLQSTQIGETNEDNCGTQFGRHPYELPCGYLWNVYYHQGIGSGNPYAATPEPLISPTQLDSYQGDGSLTGARGIGTGYSTTNHAAQDLDGDGILDAVHHLEEGVWKVWRGRLESDRGAIKLQFDRGAPLAWQAPGPVSDSTNPANRGWGDRYFKSRVRKTMLDIGGDGLSDYVFSTSNLSQWRYRNKRNGFYQATRGTFANFGVFDSLGKSITKSNDPTPGTTFINSGERFACIRALDYDHDGRVDLMECGDSDEPWRTPRIAYNNGDRVGIPVEINHWGGQDRQHGIYQRVRGESLAAPHFWYLLGEFIDLDGDGLEEDISPSFSDPNRVTGEPAGSFPRLMYSIDNGAGLVTTIAYAAHTDESVVEPGSGRTPNAAVVVKSITRADAHGAGGATNYTYRGPVFNADDDHRSGFRGFAEARTRTPLGALEVNRYDYDVDWSGRLAETLLFRRQGDYGGDASSSGSDSAHSISTATWTAHSLFGGRTTSFHATENRKYTCENAQAIDECVASGALLFTETTLSPITSHLDSSQPPQAYAETLRWVRDGEGGSIGDAKHVTQYDLYSDAGTYMLRSVDKQMHRTLNASGATTRLRTRTRNHFTSDGRRRYRVDNYSSNAVASSTYSDIDAATGNVLFTVKPQQYADHGQAGPNTAVTYDDFGLYPRTTTNELGHVVTTSYDVGTGKMLTQEGPNALGGVAQGESLSYDPFGRLLARRVTRQVGSAYVAGNEIEKFTYFDQTSPQRVRRQKLIDFDESRWTRRDESFDGHGRLLKSRTYLGAGLRPDPVIRYTYDAGGNLIETTLPDPSKDGPENVTYTTTYDSLGRATAFSTPATDHAELTITYDGLVQARTKYSAPQTVAETSITTNDVFGRLVKVEEQTSAGQWATTAYEHDVYLGAGLFSFRVTSADGIVTDAAVDYLNRRTEIRRGDRSWRYTYDRNGNMLTSIDPAPVGASVSDYTTSVVYDDLDRPTSKLPGSRGMSAAELGELGVGLTLYGYDEGDGGIGKLTSTARGQTLAIDYQHDARGNVVGEDIAVEIPTVSGVRSESRSTSSSFNAMGALRETVLADGSLIGTDYDVAGRPIGLSKDEVLVATIGRNVAGFPIVRDAPGTSIRRIVSYDNIGRVVQDLVQPSPGRTNLKQNFTYNGGLHQITRLDHFVGEGLFTPQQDTFTFAYDLQNQIESATGPVGYDATFGYTPGGRLARANVAVNPAAPDAVARDVTYDYSGDSDPEALDALVDVGSSENFASYTYDESGNTTVRTEPVGTWAFVYDGEDQQRQATAPDGSREAYRYHEGARFLAVERDASGWPVKTRFWWGGAEIWFDDQGQAETTFAHASLDGPTIRIKNGTEVEHTFHDGRGHLLASLGPDGGLRAGFTYGPFGEVLEEKGALSDDSLRRFNGKDVDDVSALSYYGFRYYDSLSLTWTQADPKYRFLPEAAFNEPRRSNLYAFTMNNPLSMVDADGLDSGPVPIQVNIEIAKNASKEKVTYATQVAVARINNAVGEKALVVNVQEKGAKAVPHGEMTMVIGSKRDKAEVSTRLKTRTAGKEVDANLTKHTAAAEKANGPTAGAGNMHPVWGLGGILSPDADGGPESFESAVTATLRLSYLIQHELMHGLGVANGPDGTPDGHPTDPNNVMAKKIKNDGVDPGQVATMKTQLEKMREDREKYR